METRVNESANYGNERLIAVKKLSWGSIWAGALVGIVAMILLNMLGIGIGFSALDIESEKNAINGIGIATIIWYVLSSLISLYVAGWVSGRLAQTRRVFDGAMHGILTWCVITLASIYFLTTAIGNIVGGAGRLVGGTLNSVSQGSGKILELAAPEIKSQISSMDFNEMQKNGTSQQIISLLKDADGDPAKINRNDLAAIIKKETKKTDAQSQVTADSLINVYQNAVTKFIENKDEMIVQAKKTGDDIADGASTAFIIAFFAFLIGAIAAGFGAKIGTESKSNVYFERNIESVH